MEKINSLFYVRSSPAYSNRQMVNSELTADNYFIQHMRYTANTYSCWIPAQTPVQRVVSFYDCPTL